MFVYQHGTSLSEQSWHTYIGCNQQFSNRTWGSLNEREIMTGKRNLLANYLGPVKSLIMEEDLQLPLIKPGILKYILNMWPYTQRYISIILTPYQGNFSLQWMDPISENPVDQNEELWAYCQLIQNSLVSEHSENIMNLDFYRFLLVNLWIWFIYWVWLLLFKMHLRIIFV